MLALLLESTGILAVIPFSLVAASSQHLNVAINQVVGALHIDHFYKDPMIYINKETEPQKKTQKKTQDSSRLDS